MSRGDQRTAAVAAALALGGCMRIYPDPELPDVTVEWVVEFECVDDSDRVAVSLTEGDPAVEIAAASAPCRDGTMSLPDVPRRHYLFTAKLESGGAEVAEYETEVDLRDGLSEKVFPYFESLRDNFRVAWTFDMGATCASLSAELVRLTASMPFMGAPVYDWHVLCEEPDFTEVLPIAGVYTVSAVALSGGVVVAASPESPPTTVSFNVLTDFGTLTLSPCGGSCPPLEPR